ncbi:uncharacterized protein mxt isoform X2 [Planococcus citri]|uniref:uncharacterized protein mxt isoform X2 n=1 Tax=Planococcus citri TaxID=170843 RepID=UPI0031FA31D2
MSSSGLGRGSSTRTVRKIEAPRPLKTANSAVSNESKKHAPSSLVLPSKAIDSAEKLLLLMDAVVSGILSTDELSLKPENKSLLTANIVILCENLKKFGPQLEGSLYRGQLDRAFHTFREGMVRNNLEFEARVHLLDILELRECNWLLRRNSKTLVVKNCIPPSDEDSSTIKLSTHQSESTTHLGADEVIKSSGKYRDKPSKSSKNYCKEEIIIRNADSGKVMGIKGRRVHMIEQLSDTIISFQKVQPTFKERLVQITGPNDEKISYATQLIEDTIRNNASPVRELGGSESSFSSDEFCEKQVPEDDNLANWSLSSNACQYKHKVTYNDCVLTITGNDYNYVTLAKEVLDDYFLKLSTKYSESDDLARAADDYLENDVFFEPSVHVDETIQDLAMHFGAGDVKIEEEEEEDELLEQLHKELNGIEIEPESSPVNEIISISDSLDENDDTGSSSTDINFPRYVYTKEFLLECRTKPICQREPENFDRVRERFPKLMKTNLRRSSSSPSKGDNNIRRSSSSPTQSDNNNQNETL